MSVINKLFENSAYIITISTNESFNLFKNRFMNNNPGFIILEDSKMDFPNKYICLLSWKLKTATFEKVDQEFTV